jgi:hypothetical protein
MDRSISLARSRAFSRHPGGLSHAHARGSTAAGFAGSSSQDDNCQAEIRDENVDTGVDVVDGGNVDQFIKK